MKRLSEGDSLQDDAWNRHLEELEITEDHLEYALSDRLRFNAGWNAAIAASIGVMARLISAEGETE